MLKQINKTNWLTGAVLCGSVLFSGMAHATLFQYSFTFDPDNIVTGTFEGTANGNLVTNLSNITATFNGVDFIGSGSLYNAAYDYIWLTGTGYASFDGTENNFLFYNDEDEFTNSKNYFFSVSDPRLGYSAIQTGSASLSVNAREGHFSQWSLSEVSVPAPASITLIALGLAGMAKVRRKQAR